MSLNPDRIFIEEQKFDSPKARYIAILLSVIFIAGLAWSVAAPLGTVAKIIGYISFFGCFVMFVVDFYIFLKSLTIKIDAEGIAFNEKPSKVEMLFKWEYIDQIFIRHYKYGIVGNKNGQAYGLKGKTGIQIVFKNGEKLQLGVQNIAEVKRVIECYFKKKVVDYKPN